MNQEKVLIVEDEEHARSGLAETIAQWGYRVETACDGQEGLEKAQQWLPAIVVTDLMMPRMTGMKLLELLTAPSFNTTVIVVTAQGSIGSAVEAMRKGAYDYIEKPVDTGRLRTILQNATMLQGTRAELEVARRQVRNTGTLGHLIGSSKKMLEIFHLIDMVAPSTASVLITGASGTGKEMVARTIHELSPRKSRPFVPINCAAIPETLIESEIFGHEKGAFTGALERRTGCFELAEGGTLLLDELLAQPTGLDTDGGGMPGIIGSGLPKSIDRDGIFLQFIGLTGDRLLSKELEQAAEHLRSTELFTLQNAVDLRQKAIVVDEGTHRRQRNVRLRCH